MRTILKSWIVLFSFVPTVAAVDYFPLKEGNQWSYSMSNGMQMTMAVREFTRIGDVLCAAVETTMGTQITREYLAVDAEGLKAYMSQVQGQE